MFSWSDVSCTASCTCQSWIHSTTHSTIKRVGLGAMIKLATRPVIQVGWFTPNYRSTSSITTHSSAHGWGVFTNLISPLFSLLRPLALTQVWNAFIVIELHTIVWVIPAISNVCGTSSFCRSVCLGNFTWVIALFEPVGLHTYPQKRGLTEAEQEKQLNNVSNLN